MMKKLISLLLAAIMLLGCLSACAGKEKPAEDTANAASQQENAPSGESAEDAAAFRPEASISLSLF